MKVENKNLLLYCARKSVGEVSLAGAKCESEENVYFAIGTAVHWLMDGIDRIPKNLIKQEHVKMFSAIRYVNNCLKHNATFKEAHKIEGLDYPFDYPFDYGAHYIWVPTENIEISEKNKKQKENYDAELKWKNVYKTLSDILKVVEEYYSEF